MKDQLAVSLLIAGGASLSVAAADSYSIAVLGVPLPIAAAVLGGALVTSSIVPSRGRLAALWRVLLSTLVGCYAVPAAVAGVQFWLGAQAAPAATHKFIAAACGVTTILFLEGLASIAKQAPRDIWQRLMSFVGRNQQVGGKDV